MTHNNNNNPKHNNNIFRSSSSTPNHKSSRPPLYLAPRNNSRYESGYTEYDEINNISNQKNTELQQYYNNINNNKIEVNQIINTINTNMSKCLNLSNGNVILYENQLKLNNKNMEEVNNNLNIMNNNLNNINNKLSNINISKALDVFNKQISKKLSDKFDLFAKNMINNQILTQKKLNKIDKIDEHMIIINKNQESIQIKTNEIDLSLKQYDLNLEKTNKKIKELLLKQIEPKALEKSLIKIIHNKFDASLKRNKKYINEKDTLLEQRLKETVGKQINSLRLDLSIIHDEYMELFNDLDINYNNNNKLNEIKLKKNDITNKFDLNYDFNVLNNNYKDTKTIEKSLELNGKNSISLVDKHKNKKNIKNKNKNNMNKNKPPDISCCKYPNCIYGDKCKYIYPSKNVSLQAPHNLCRLYPQCHYGRNCKFYHPTNEEIKYWYHNSTNEEMEIWCECYNLYERYIEHSDNECTRVNYKLNKKTLQNGTRMNQ